MLLPMVNSNAEVSIAHVEDKPGGGAKPEQLVRGMYELLGGVDSTRSGQFRFPDTDGHLLVDFSLSTAPDRKATYRFINSGDIPFGLFANNASGTTPFAILKKKRSFDVFIQKGEQIWVKSPQGTPNTPVTGVYQLLDID